MSKLSALKKAMQAAKKVAGNKKVKKAAGVAAGAGLAKVAYDGATREPAKPAKRKNPNEKGTRAYIEWEIREQKRRGELPANYPEKLPPAPKGTIPDGY